MGGATDREVERLRQYARDIGLAFQVLLVHRTLGGVLAAVLHAPTNAVVKISLKLLLNPTLQSPLHERFKRDHVM